MMRFVPIPIDERAAAASRRRNAYHPPAREIDASLWAGVLFWFGFASLAIIAGF